MGFQASLKSYVNKISLSLLLQRDRDSTEMSVMYLGSPAVSVTGLGIAAGSAVFVSTEPQVK